MKKIVTLFSVIAAICTLASCASNSEPAPTPQPAPAPVHHHHHHHDYKGEAQ